MPPWRLWIIVSQFMRHLKGISVNNPSARVPPEAVQMKVDRGIGFRYHYSEGLWGNCCLQPKEIPKQHRKRGK